MNFVRYLFLKLYDYNYEMMFIEICEKKTRKSLTKQSDGTKIQLASLISTFICFEFRAFNKNEFFPMRTFYLA